jgi:hypothetical protein
METIMSRFSLVAVALCVFLSCAIPGFAGTFLAAPSYATGNSPIAVAVADFNGDGRPDLAVANNRDGTVSVLLANADGTFQAAHNYGAGTAPKSVVAGDFNGDGRMDLAVANAMTNNVSILIGNGNGTFQAAVNYAAGSAPQAVVSADFNGDGKLDLAVANQSLGAGPKVSVLLGNGDGTFRPLVGYKAENPLSLAVGDMNADGLLDLVVGNNGGGSIQVLPGKGDGTFLPAIKSSSFQGIASIQVGDFNRDGRLDVAWGLNVQLGNGDGTLQAPVSVGLADASGGVAVADMNGDGKLDLVTAGSNAGHASLALGNGDGTFAPAVSYLAQPGTKAAAVADFNGDGRLDIVVTNQSSNTVTVFLANSTGSFQGSAQYGDSNVGAAAATFADFDRDGRVDLAVAVTDSAESDAMVLTYRGNGDGTFQSAVGYDVGSSALSITAGDFNRDGIVDLAETNACEVRGCGSSPGVLNILLGNADGSFQSAVPYAALTEPYSVTAADLDHDGLLDLVVAQRPGGDVGVFRGLTAGTFQTELTRNAGGSPLALALADLNGDGNVDAIVANECTSVVGGCNGTVGVLLGRANGSFQSAVTYDGGKNPSSVAVGDFNGDGKLDVAVVSTVVTGVTDGGLEVLLGNGDGTLRPPVAYDAGAGTLVVAAADVNGDGKLDLLVTNSGNTAPTTNGGGMVAVLLGNGDGTFQPKIEYPTGRFANFVSAADLNGDGAPDVETAGADGVTILMNAGGTRVSTTNTPNPSTLQQAVTFTASLSASVSGVAAIPTGTVTFFDGAAALGSAPLTNGQAVFRTSTLSGGSHSITAAYSGDGQFNPHNAAPATQTVLMPVVNLNPVALNFGNQKVGTTSAGQAVKLTNRGLGALTIAGITTTGSYSQTNNCGASLASNQSCTITVKFTPSALGTQSGTLSIKDNAAGSPQKVTLTGVGT